MNMNDEPNILNAIVGIIMLILSICLIVDTIQLKNTYCHAKVNGVCQKELGWFDENN